MDLREVRGIGRATEEKLNASGIRSAADLAWVDDIESLAARSGIPVSRLTTLRHEAARADHRPVPPARMALRRMLASANRLGALMMERLGIRLPLQRQLGDA